MDNNSILNNESIETFNKWLFETYNITPSMISTTYNLPVETLYYAVLNWRDTEAASKAVINTLPVWFIKALNQYAKTNAKFKYQFNTIINEDTSDNSRNYIFNLLERKASSLKADATSGSLDIQYDIVNQITIPVPEGFDGNLAYVKLYVPPEVITAMHLRTTSEYVDVPSVRDDSLIHPLLRATRTYFEGTEDYVDTIDMINTTGGWDGGWGCTASDSRWGAGPVPNKNTLTSQMYGNYRINPIFFYATYTDKETLSIDVIKNQKEIKINVNCIDFMFPFASVNTEYDTNYVAILPKIGVDITYYKWGVL